MLTNNILTKGCGMPSIRRHNLANAILFCHRPTNAFDIIEWISLKFLNRRIEDGRPWQVNFPIGGPALVQFGVLNGLLEEALLFRSRIGLIVLGRTAAAAFARTDTRDCRAHGIDESGGMLEVSTVLEWMLRLIV